MAKKNKKKELIGESGFNYTETNKRMDKYYKACESEKKGKAAVVSIIGFSVLCFIVLLVILLKMSGVGKTIVFTSPDAPPQVADTEEVSGKPLYEIVEDELEEKNDKTVPAETDTTVRQ